MWAQWPDLLAVEVTVVVVVGVEVVGNPCDATHDGISILRVWHSNSYTYSTSIPALILVRMLYCTLHTVLHHVPVLVCSSSFYCEVPSQSRSSVRSALPSLSSSSSRWSGMPAHLARWCRIQSTSTQYILCMNILLLIGAGCFRLCSLSPKYL